MIAQLINEHIASLRQSTEFKTDKFRCSDAGRCHLMRYWKRQGKQADGFDERTLRVFEVGHLFHAWVQNILGQRGVLIDAELEVEDKHRRGHLDAIVDTPAGLILYDFKTVHSRKFHWNRKDGKPIDRHYAMQAMTYAMMLPIGVADIRIAYISKDDLCIEEASVFDVDNIIDATRWDWLSLITCWDAQTEPNPNPMTWECGYCIYGTECEHGKKVRAIKKVSKKKAAVREAVPVN
jgi:hypothetical protein